MHASDQAGEGLRRAGLMVALTALLVLAGVAVLVHRGEPVARPTLYGAITLSLLVLCNTRMVRRPSPACGLVGILLPLLLIASASLWLWVIVSA